MSQKIKVQDGNIVYSNADPSQPVNMTVLGVTNITNEIIIGSINTLADGVITAGDGHPATLLGPAEYTRLDIIAGNYGSLNLSQSSSANSVITINGAAWPITHPIPGMFLGVSGLNTLEYIPFILATNPSDSLTESQLNSLYPGAQIGQSVIGTTVLYTCVGANTWRTLGQTSGGTISAPTNEIVYGTGSSVSSNASLTYNSATSTLAIGSTGPATLSADPAQPLHIASDVSVTISTAGVDGIVLDAAGTVTIGHPGPALVSSNPAQPLGLSSDVSVTISTAGVDKIVVNTAGTTFAGFVQFGHYATAPTSPVNGMVYYDTTLNKFRGYENGLWVSFTTA